VDDELPVNRDVLSLHLAFQVAVAAAERGRLRIRGAASAETGGVLDAVGGSELADGEALLGLVG
jgi:hypothetical protein